MYQKNNNPFMRLTLNAKIILKNYYLHFFHRFYSWKFFLRRFQKDLNQLALFDWRKNR
jgi:hypothetical protein